MIARILAFTHARVEQARFDVPAHPASHAKSIIDKHGDHAQVHQDLTTNDLMEVAMEQEASANSRLTELSHLLRNGCQAVESMQLW